MESIQGVTAEVDKLQQGWVLLKVVAVTDYDWVAIFTDGADKPPKQKIRNVSVACPVVLECDACSMKKHGHCKDNIITGEEAIKK